MSRTIFLVFALVLFAVATSTFAPEPLRGRLIAGGLAAYMLSQLFPGI